MGLDERRIQHAVPAFDVHSSLISIEATGESTDIFPLAARRICRQVRSSDTVLLLEKVCALVLPVTPFSGAQAVASRIAQCLTDIPCQVRVYHGATALLVLQNLREAGARSISHEECAEMSCSTTQRAEQMGHAAPKEMASDILPYLAFLTNYPPPRLLHLLPYELAYRYQCVPVGAEHKVLTLATCRWLNREIVAQLHSATRREIFQVRCEMAMIDEVLHYWQRLQAMADLAQVEAQMDEACHSSR